MHTLRLRLQSITGHENSSLHRQSVKLELSVQSSQNIASIVNPVVPKRGIEQAFACLYFLTKRIPHTTNFEPLLDFLELMGFHVKSCCKECYIYKFQIYSGNGFHYV